jgi:hypothetical protein
LYSLRLIPAFIFFDEDVFSLARETLPSIFRWTVSLSVIVPNDRYLGLSSTVRPLSNLASYPFPLSFAGNIKLFFLAIFPFICLCFNF